MGTRDLAWLDFVHRIEKPPERVVSLVPSITESLFELNLGENLVGVTDFCVYPPEKVAPLPKLGGTKNPRVDAILALEPDLVIANQEENDKTAVQALQTAGVSLWLTFPQTVDDSLALLRGLAQLFQAPQALQQVEMLEVALEWAEAAVADLDPVPYFCPIWQETRREGEVRWMTFNRETYCHDLLRRFGGWNLFQDRRRQVPHPSESKSTEEQPAIISEALDTRYPWVTVEDVVTARPAVVLLPDEPFAFNENHRSAVLEIFAETPAVQHRRVHLFDGSLLTWHGTRLAKALQTLPMHLAP